MLKLHASILLLAAACFLAVGNLQVAPPKPSRGPKINAEQLFKKMDTDRDRKVSLEEFIKASKHLDEFKAEQHVRKADLNGDAALTMAEFRRLDLEKLRPKSTKGGAKKGGGKKKR
ncbi:MAG: hypothetical protein HQ581_21425 [Planctomycetes bacterium]|nr:hypothetical protein [Planctomycetota bacterium]